MCKMRIINAEIQVHVLNAVRPLLILVTISQNGGTESINTISNRLIEKISKLTKAAAGIALE